MEKTEFEIQSLAALKEEKKKRKSLERIVAIQRQQLAELQPNISYYDIVLRCKNVLLIDVIAEDYGWSKEDMNKFLKKQGIQYKQGKVWLLHQKYAEMGITRTKTLVFDDEGDDCVEVHTYWTQKGRLFIYDLMKSCGNLPLIEQEDSIW